MAIHAGDMVVGIRGDASQLTPDLAKADAALRSWGAKANRSLAGVEKGVGRINKSWSTLSRTLAGGFSVYGLIRFTRATIGAASDLEEVVSKFDTVFRGNVKQAEDWSKGLQASFQLSERAAKEYLASIQDLLVPLGVARMQAGALSNAVVKLAVDIGSFSNRQVSDVFRDIQAAMTGSFETMKKYGVALSVAAIEQKALAEGYVKTKNELTPAIKAITAFKLIVEGSGDAIGDAVKTRNSYANMLKDFKARWEDLTATIGKGFLPVASAALDVLTRTVKWYNNWVRTLALDPNVGLTLLDKTTIESGTEALDKAKNKLDGLQAAANEMRKRGPVSDEMVKRIEKAQTEVDILSDHLKKVKGIMGIVDLEPSMGSYSDRIKEAQEAIAEALANTGGSVDSLNNKVKASAAEMKAIISNVEKLKIAEKSAVGDRLSDDITRHMDLVHKLADMELQAEINKAQKIEEVTINHYEKLRQLREEYTPGKVMEEQKALKAFVSQAEQDFKQLELVIGGWAKDSADAIAEFAVNGKFSFKDMIQSMIKDLISLMAYQTITKPLFGAIGGLFGGGGTSSLYGASSISAFNFHRGGIVGETTATRSLPSALLAFAPRLHSGLMPGEFPAILQKGEAVIPKDQVGQGGGGDSYNITINALDSQSFTEFVRRNPGAIIDTVNRNVKGRGILRGTIKGAM